MKLLVLYHPQSEHSRTVEDFVHEYAYRVHGHEAELLSLETREGAKAAKLYGIVQYPAILALRDDGQLMKHWEGTTLPLINEVAAYARA